MPVAEPAGLPSPAMPAAPAEAAAPAPAGVSRRRAIGEVLLCSGYPTQLSIAGLLQGFGVTARTPNGELSATFVFLVSTIDAFVLLTLIWMLLARQGVRPLSALIGSRTPAREAMLGLAMAPALLIGVGVLLLALRTAAPWLHNVPTNPLLSLADSRFGLIASIAVVVVAGGVREEFQRAFLLRRFQERLGGPLVGVIATSAAFGLGHIVQGWDAAIATGVLGAVWSLLILARGGAMAALACHAAFNTIQLLIAGAVMDV